MGDRRPLAEPDVRLTPDFARGFDCGFLPEGTGTGALSGAMLSCLRKVLLLLWDG